MPALVPVVVTVVALALAVVHLTTPSAAIDGTTVALLGIAALPWLGAIFKTIELPGGIKAEYRDGVLALSLPRSERDRPRTIRIS